MTKPAFSSLFRSARCLRTALLLALVVPSGLAFAEDAKPNSLSEKSSEVFSKLGALLKDSKWDAALDLLNGLIPQLGPESYDMAEVLQTKGKLLLQKEDYAKALPPLETALKLADSHQYFDQAQSLMLVDLIARLYSQEAVGNKDNNVQQQYFAKAVSYFKRWMKETPKPNADSALFYAQILVQQATARQDGKVDLALIKEARGRIEEVLNTTIKPKENVYYLLYFTLQQEGEIEKSAEVLESLVKQYPTKSNYWQQLMATYVTLAGTYEKDPQKARKYHVRAINTIERAQQNGFLKGAKDQYNLLVIYSQAGQFGRSTELLYGGLKNGTIESDVKNWVLLSQAYQQASQDQQAIAALKEAAKLFPQSGELEFRIGQLYTGMDNTKEANEHYRLSTAKGGGDKPYATAMFFAYTSYELEQFEEALKAIETAEKFQPKDKPDEKLKKMKEAIEAAIRERDAKKAESAKKAAEAGKL